MTRKNHMNMIEKCIFNDEICPKMLLFKYHNIFFRFTTIYLLGFALQYCVYLFELFSPIINVFKHVHNESIKYSKTLSKWSL